MTSNNKRDKKAAQEAAKNRTLIIIGVIAALGLAAIIVGTSGQDTQAPNDLIHADAPPASEEMPADAVHGNLNSYDSAPPMTIDTEAEYFATFKMATGGEFVVQLHPAEAPITVNSFVFLAREGYFGGVTFHPKAWTRLLGSHGLQVISSQLGLGHDYWMWTTSR